MRGVGYPAGVAIVDACAGGCVLGSERTLERPEERMPPRLHRKLPSINISAEGREIRVQRAISTYSTAARVMYSSSSCDGATHVLSTLLRTVCPLRTASTAAAQRATYECTYVIYSRTCDICTAAAVVPAVMELLRMHCQRCYVRYVLRTAVPTAAAAVVLPFYAAALWVIASPAAYSQRFYKQYSCSIIVAGNYPAFCGTHNIPIHLTLPPPPPSRITILHLLAATTDGPSEAFHGQEYQVDRDRRYDGVSSCRRAYEPKECGDNERVPYDFSKKLLLVESFGI